MIPRVKKTDLLNLWSAHNDYMWDNLEKKIFNSCRVAVNDAVYAKLAQIDDEIYPLEKLIDNMLCNGLRQNLSQPKFFSFEAE